jgi:hypothetical protein
MSEDEFEDDGETEEEIEAETEEDDLANMRKEKEKTISKIDQEQLVEGSKEVTEDSTEDMRKRFSKKHEFEEKTLDPLNTGTFKTTKKIVADPDDEPEIPPEDSEETE